MANNALAIDDERLWHTIDAPVNADSPVAITGIRDVEVAFNADNPGEWLFHCHVLEHHAAGMSAVVRVT